MNGTVRPYENPTTNIAVLPLVYFFAQGMCLYLLRSGFSVGLRLAKTTEVWAKWCPCPQAFSRLRSCLPTESSMNGEVRPFAALRLFLSLAC